MVEGLGAFAGGLAEGLRSGMDMRMRQQYADRKERSDERDAELHRAKAGRANLQAEKRKRLQAANAEIASGWQRSRPDPSVPRQPFPPGLASVSTRHPVIADTRATGAAGLASLTGHKPEKRRAAMAPDEMIGRRMLTGNLPEDADELTRMANIYKKHGLLEEMTPWMNKVYLAQKKGIPDALHSLLTGDARKARQILGKSGIMLAADPVPLRGTARQQEVWRFQLEDGEEREIDLKELAKRFFPGNYLNDISGE